MTAGEITERDRIEIAWAVPLSPRSSRGRGRYWAFFPTTYESSLTGILNAPWKTNSDRQSLLEGPYNREIIEAGAGLVAERLAELDNSEDHGAHLDLLPARRANSCYERLAPPSAAYQRTMYAGYRRNAFSIAPRGATAPRLLRRR